MTDFLTAAVKWVETRFEDGDISENTARSYTASLRMFARYATIAVEHPVTVEEVTHALVRQWVGALRRRRNQRTGQPLKAETIYNRISAMRAFYDWATSPEAGPLVEVDPMAHIRNPKLASRTPRDLEDKVVRDAIKKADARTRLMILIAVHCGLRRAEIARLRRADVRLDSRKLFVFGKGSKERLVPIPDELVGELERWMRRPDADRSDFMFPSGKHKGSQPIGAARVGRLFAEVMPEGTEATTHRYRHTAAVAVLRKGGDIRKVQQMLGHADISTTTRYLNHDIAGLAEAMEGRSYADDPETPEAA